LQGLTGPIGPSGVTGATGPDGNTGATGPQGTPGINGTTGATGPQGTAGINGDTGATGPQGTAGTNGNTGATGPQGTAGINGDTGATGPQGTAGTNGDTGPTGPSGVTGATGPDGATFTTLTVYTGSPTILSKTSITLNATGDEVSSLEYLTSGKQGIYFQTQANTIALGDSIKIGIDTRSGSQYFFELDKNGYTANNASGVLTASVAYTNGTVFSIYTDGLANVYFIVNGVTVISDALSISQPYVCFLKAGASLSTTQTLTNIRFYPTGAKGSEGATGPTGPTVSSSTATGAILYWNGTEIVGDANLIYDPTWTGPTGAQGKITFPGLFDPIGLMLTPSPSNPASTGPNSSTTLWVNSSGKLYMGTTEVGTGGNQSITFDGGTPSTVFSPGPIFDLGGPT
jgi:hypothetical protein